MTKLMKALMFAFIASTLFVVSLAAQANPEKPKFTISIRSENPEVISGSNIDIWMTTTNISDEVIRVQFGYHGNMPDDFYYDIRDEQGAGVAKTVYNDIRPSRGPGSTRPGYLEPGKSAEARARVSDIYAFDRLGKYTIRVWRRAANVMDDSESNRVYSNTITITVLAADPAPDTAK
jgi:hypothetical protein